MALAIYSDKGTQGAALPRTSVIGIALSLAAPTVGAGNALNIRIARDISQHPLLGPDTPPPLPALATALLGILVISPALMALSATLQQLSSGATSTPP